MTNLQIFTPFIFAAIFILLHYLFKGIKSARNNKKTEKTIYNDLNNYDIIEISENNFIALFLPTKKYIYLYGNKAALVFNPFDNQLEYTKIDAFKRLELFIYHYKPENEKI